MKVYCAIIILVALSSALISVKARETRDDKCQKCGHHEIWVECGSIPPNCTKTCATRNLQFKCAAVCIPTCYCVENYIREYKGGRCIPEYDCPQEKEGV